MVFSEAGCTALPGMTATVKSAIVNFVLQFFVVSIGSPGV